MTFPETIREIQDYAFLDCPYLAEVTFGKDLIKIGESAFRNTNLKKLVFPDNLSTIERYAFCNCRSLESVKFGANTTYTGTRMFQDCVSLTTVELGPKIYTINEFSFNGCSSLTSCPLPGVLVSIGVGAFMGCSSLPEIRIPDEVLTVGQSAFEGCTAARTLTIGKKVHTISNFAFNTCSQLTEIVLPASVTAIGNGAMAWCSSLQTVTLPDNLYSVGWGVFAGCNRLERINSKFSTPDGRAFALRNVLKGVAPYQMTEFTTPASISYNGTTYILDTIERGCFHGIDQIEYITVAEGTKYIGFDAFLNSKIMCLTLPNSLEDIRTTAFSGCYQLNTVIFGENIKHIFTEAFKNCASLHEIYIPAINPPKGGRSYYTDSDNTYTQSYYDYMSADVFSGFDKNACTVFAPKASIDAYRSATGWRDFPVYKFLKEANRLEAGAVMAKPNGAADLCVDMFNATDITSFQCDIVLPEGASVRIVDDEPEVALSSRAARTHSVNANMINSNTLRVVCYSSRSAAFSDNEGQLFNVSLIAPADRGTYPITITNIQLTAPDGQEFTPEDVVVDFVVESGLKGDANNDEKVNVTDLVYMVNYILKYNPEGFNFGNADVNEDGVINISDVVQTVNIILAVQAQAPAKASALPTADALLTLGSFAIEPGEYRDVDLCLSNANLPFTALQFTMTLPEGLRVESDKQFTAGSRLSLSHSIASVRSQSGEYTVICYSAENAEFSGISGVLMNMGIVADDNFRGGEIRIHSIIATEANGAQHTLDDVTSTASVGTSAIAAIAAQQAEDAEFYTLDGRRVDGTPAPGCYIRRTASSVEKVIVK